MPRRARLRGRAPRHRHADRIPRARRRPAPPAASRRRGPADHLSTVHRAKGSEARLVVLLACEEQLLPSWRSLQSPDPEQLAEERRLFYVACTRAKDRLAITHAAARNRRPTAGPSRFLIEAGLTHPQALAA